MLSFSVANLFWSRWNERF